MKQIHNEIHRYNTSQKYNVRMNRQRAALAQSGPQYHASQIHKLPADIRTCTDLVVFKK